MAAKELQKMPKSLSIEYGDDLEDKEIGDEAIAERLWELFLAKGCKVQWLRDWKPDTSEDTPVKDTTCTGRRRSSLTPRKSVYDHLNRERGLSPLMEAVEKNFLRTSFSLLMYGANPNLQHEETGDTALHIAVSNANLPMVKALLVANADTTIRNTHKETPLDVAVNVKQQRGGTPDIKLAFIGFFRSPAPNEDRLLSDSALSGDIDGIIKVLIQANSAQAKTLKYFDEHSVLPKKPSPEGTYLLSLDGGGVRAFNVTQAMVNIEERMSQLVTDKCKHLYRYFDYIAGTSSGGIAACALPYCKIDAYSGRAIVHRGTTNVFGGPYAERGDRMDKFLQDIFTPDLRMDDLDPPARSIVTGSLATVSPYKLHLMTSYGGPRDGQAGPKERRVWEACRVSTAAPTYFPLLRDIKILDGGLVANNPTLDAMAEIISQERSEGKEVKLACVVSIGTGIVPERENQVVELFEPSSLAMIQNVSKDLSAFKTLVTHFASQVTRADGQEVTRAREFSHALGCRYFRLTPPLKQDVDLATSNIELLIDMMYNTQIHYLENPEMIDEIAKLLICKPGHYCEL